MSAIILIITLMALMMANPCIAISICEMQLNCRCNSDIVSCECAGTSQMVVINSSMAFSGGATRFEIANCQNVRIESMSNVIIGWLQIRNVYDLHISAGARIKVNNLTVDNVAEMHLQADNLQQGSAPQIFTFSRTHFSNIAPSTFASNLQVKTLEFQDCNFGTIQSSAIDEPATTLVQDSLFVMRNCTVREIGSNAVKITVRRAEISACTFANDVPASTFSLSSVRHFQLLSNEFKGRLRGNAFVVQSSASVAIRNNTFQFVANSAFSHVRYDNAFDFDNRMANVSVTDNRVGQVDGIPLMINVHSFVPNSDQVCRTCIVHGNQLPCSCQAMFNISTQLNNTINSYDRKFAHDMLNSRCTRSNAPVLDMLNAYNAGDRTNEQTRCTSGAHHSAHSIAFTLIWSVLFKLAVF